MLDETPLLGAVRALGLEALGRSSEGREIFGGWVRALTPTLSRGREREKEPGAVLVVGGVHGDEPASVEAVVALVQRVRSATLAGAPPRSATLAAGPPRAARFAVGSLVVVPALNPDGLARGLKNSARDVDLNRNFAARNWTAAHAPGYFPGAAPLSEPETRLLADLVDAHGVRAVVAVHAPFACVNYDGPAAAWADAVAAACGWPARGDIGYPTPGSLGSWLGVDRGLPVLTLELPAGPLAAFGQQAAAALDEAVRPRESL